MLKQCDVSLPQKATFFCEVERFIELGRMKEKWKLKDSPYGFALLDVPSQWTLIRRDLISPFTRFYLEGYLQTVLATGLSHFYKFYNFYKFFGMPAKPVGVRVTFCLIVGLCLFVSLFICSSCYHYCHCHTAIEWSVCTQKAQKYTCKLMENAMTITDDTLKCQ